MDYIQDAKNNRIYSNQQNKVNIVMKGSNNVLWIEDGVVFDADSTLSFNGNNSIAFFGRNRHIIKINLSINHNCTFVLGRDDYINGKMNVIISEETNVILGDDCVFSFGLWFRTADPHLIYDCDSHQRINYSKDIIVGDHVWLGQNALILKGTQVGSGSIIGAGSVVSNKILHSNASFAGNPVKNIRNNIFWDGACVHAWTRAETEKRKNNSSEKWIYAPHSSKITIEDIVGAKYDVEKRLNAILLLYSAKNDSKERFSISTNGKNKKAGDLGRKIMRKLKSCLKRLKSFLRKLKSFWGSH